MRGGRHRDERPAGLHRRERRQGWLVLVAAFALAVAASSSLLLLFPAAGLPNRYYLPPALHASRGAEPVQPAGGEQTDGPQGGQSGGRPASRSTARSVPSPTAEPMQAPAPGVVPQPATPLSSSPSPSPATTKPKPTPDCEPSKGHRGKPSKKPQVSPSG